MVEEVTPEKSGWGWKMVIVATILSVIFMVVLYSAVNSDPDYMPSHQQKHKMMMQQQGGMEMSSEHQDMTHMHMNEKTESNSDSH